MKYWNPNIKGLLPGLVLVLAACAGASAKPVEPPGPPELTLKPFPLESKSAMDSLFAFAANSNSTFSPAMTEPLVKFVREACTTDSGWELPKRNNAAGSAYIVKIKVPLQQYLTINFHPGIPDYAVFPACLRYSAGLNSNEMARAYACIANGPTGTQTYATGRMTGFEEITPNPESGGYFSYTNARTFLRCRVAGQDALFSCSETTGASTMSNRGVLVGSLEQALFYYSGQPGLNLTGMKWMLSQINRSTTLSVYIALSSNETAVATFAWLDAGWNGINVTRASHILNSQRNTLDFSRRIAEHPGITAPLLAELIATVDKMSDAAVNAEYEQYLLFVRTFRDNEPKGRFVRGSILQDLYDDKTAQSLPMPYRRALLIQERVRVLLGVATWSAIPVS